MTPLQDFSEEMSSPTTVIPRDQRRFRCLCGLCHVVTGTQACLVWYVVSSVFSMVFGMRSTLTWLIVPICVTILGSYALCTRRHKYLYPFLIITVVQQFVCILMAVIILIFSLVSFETMRQIIGELGQKGQQLAIWEIELPRKDDPMKTISQTQEDVVAMFMEELKERQKRWREKERMWREEQEERDRRWMEKLKEKLRMLEEDEETEEDVEEEMIEADSSTDAEEVPMVETVDDVDVVASGASVKDKKKLSNGGVSLYMAEWLGKGRIRCQWKYERLGKDSESKSVPKKKVESEEESRKRDDTKIAFSKVVKEPKPRTKDMKPKKKTTWRNVQSGHSLDMEGPPTRNVALIVIGGTVAACLLLSIIHVWQAIVIYRCLEYYEDEYRKLEDGHSRSSHYETTADSRTDFD